MAFKVGQVTADVTADTSSFNRSMGMVRKKGAAIADNVTKSFREVGQKMRRIGVGMSAAISAPLVGVGSMALKTAADFESLRQSMDILNGSAEEGARNFERLKEFSAGTPFQLRGLAEAQNMLQGFGMTADDAFNSIKMIGDIAAVSGGDIKGIGIAFGQAAAEGRLMTRDIRQLINQGVPAIKLLADTMGVAQSDVLELASQGEISFEILQRAFRDATTAGGMFADGMQKQSQTLQGLFSTLKDNVSIALSDIGNSIVEAFNLKQVIKNLTANIQTIAERFRGLSKESKKQIMTVAALFAAGGPIMIALGQAAIAISAFAKLVRTRFALITAAAALVAGTIEQQSQIWSRVFGGAEGEVDNFTTATRKAFGKMAKPILEFTESAIGASGALESFQNLLAGLDGSGVSNSMGRLDDIIKETKENANVSPDVDTSGVDNAVSVFEGLANPIEQAKLQVQGVSSAISENLTPQMSMFRETAWNALTVGTEGMTLFEIATQGVENKLTTAQKAGMQFGQMLGNAFSQAVLHAKRLDDILLSVAKQLASKTLITGLQILLTGGIGKMGFFETMFGGFRAHGGPVSAGKGYVVGENGPEYFMPRSSGSIIPNGQMPSGGGMSEASMSRAFERALSRYVRGVSERQIFEMAEQGRYR